MTISDVILEIIELNQEIFIGLNEANTNSATEIALLFESEIIKNYKE